MSLSRLRRAFLALSAVAALGSLTLLVVPAGAAQDAPPSGDPRATSYAGNAVDCDDAGLPGTVVTVSFTIDATGRFVTITGVPEGTALTGVVVKGGDAFNVYLSAPWTALHAPLVGGGKNIPEISHWFACGITSTTSPTTPPVTPTTPPVTPTESPTTPPVTPTTPPVTPTESPTTPPVTPTTPPVTPTGSPTEQPTGTTPGGTVAPPTGSLGPVLPTPPTGPMPPTGGGLPLTGSSVVPMAGFGLALLLAGIALLTTPAARRRLLGR
jgi:hypothetical protein